jgi:hypothetical protein
MGQECGFQLAVTGIPDFGERPGKPADPVAEQIGEVVPPGDRRAVTGEGCIAGVIGLQEAGQKGQASRLGGLGGATN